MLYFNVITKKLLNSNLIITLCLLYTIPAQALHFSSPLIEGQLAYGQIEAGETLLIDSQFLRVGKMKSPQTIIKTSPQGEFVIGIPQDTQRITLYIKTDKTTSPHHYSVQKRDWDEEYIQGLPPQKITPSVKNKERISQEFSLMKQKRKISEFHEFPDTWKRPVSSFKRISSQFGSRRILNNIKRQGHSGTDYAAPTGTPIVATRDGIVKLIHPNMFYSGKTILIDHGYHIFSSYSHLNKIFVKENQKVKAGDPIGEIGMTGRATGPHLHFGISWYNVRVDPEVLFSDKKRKSTRQEIK